MKLTLLEAPARGRKEKIAKRRRPKKLTLVEAPTREAAWDMLVDYLFYIAHEMAVYRIQEMDIHPLDRQNNPQWMWDAAKYSRLRMPITKIEFQRMRHAFRRWEQYEEADVKPVFYFKSLQARSDERP